MARYMGLFDRAKTYYGTALELARTKGETQNVSAILNDIGVINLEEGLPSLDLFREALAISRANSDAKGELTAISNLAGALQNDFQFENALGRYKEAIALALSNDYAIFEPVLTFNMAELTEKNGRLTEAVEHFTRAAELGNKKGIDEVFIRGMLGLVRVNLRMGKVTQARQHLEEVEERAKRDIRHRFSLEIEKLRLNILTGKTPDNIDFLSRMYGRMKATDRWELYRLETLSPSAGIQLDSLTDPSDILRGCEEYRALRGDAQPESDYVDSLLKKGDFWGATVLALSMSEENPSTLERIETDEPLLIGLIQMERGRLAAMDEMWPSARKFLENARFHFGVLSNELLLDEVEQISQSMIRRGNDLTSRDTMAILEVINSISASLEIDDVLAKILDEVLRISGAERGIIFLLDGNTPQPHLVREHGKKKSPRRVRYSSSVINAVMRTGDALFKESVLDDSALSQKDSVMDLSIRMVFCVPFSVDGEIIGLLYTDSKLGSEAFSLSRRNILEILAKSAAIAIRNAREHAILLKEKDTLKNSFQSRFEGMIGDSPPMRELYHRMYIVSEEEMPVLITGETGTGKDLVSRIIHNNGPRKEGTFIPINCAAVPENLLESELFGYEPGAFTGATKRKLGKFELANGGTLFLNEIGEMPTKLQAKLLSVIETGVLHRLGGNRDINIDARIIAATNRNLKQAIEEGIFREDLFYRLAVLKLDIPPLRDRRTDIPLLIDHFLTRISEKSRRRIGGISRKALDLLMRFSWPGNVRQLQNVLEQAALFAREDLITPSDLPTEVQMGSTGMETGMPMTYDGLKDAKEELERRILLELLENHNWHVADAARAFDMDRTRLHQLIKKHGLRRGKNS